MKLLKIDTCHHCKHAMLGHNNGFCREEKRKFSYDNGAKIPIWCPLENAPVGSFEMLDEEIAK